jgi:hypothetical protein
MPASLSRLILATLLALPIGALPRVALAQAGTGSLVGRVLDSSDAPVPGATVVATSATTGAARETTSGTAGLFTLTGLPPGRYRVEARLTGFRTAVREPVTVNVETRTDVPLRLEPGDVTETVTVRRSSTAPPPPSVPSWTASSWRISRSTGAASRRCSNSRRGWC